MGHDEPDARSTARKNSNQSFFKQFRSVYLIGTTAVLILSLVALALPGSTFAETMTFANNWLLDRFGWLYSSGTLAVMIVCILVYVSPLGRVRIGGREATTKLRKGTFYAIVLCTMIAVGLLMWGGAEILAHYANPPEFWGVDPLSEESASMGMAQVLIDWTFPPFGLYALPAVLFAFVFYNMKKRFSLSSMLAPLFGDRISDTASQIIDIICSFALICGMATTLGQGVMSILAGAGYLSGTSGLEANVSATVGLVIAIGVIYVISAVTGVLNGISFFSRINAVALTVLGVFVFLAGPTLFILNFATQSIGTFANEFFSMMLNTGAITGERWAYDWPIFYFAVYLAWAMISAVFLGRISKGFSVRTVLNATFVIPSLVSGAWLAIMSATSLDLQFSGVDMVGVFESGIPNVSYAILDHLPLAHLLAVVYIILLFVGFVTGGDSLTTAVAGLCADDTLGENGEPPRSMVLYWGVLVVGVTAICALFLDFEELRAVSNIGAFPALIVELLGMVALWRVMWHPARYDVHTQDYDEYGEPIPATAPEGAQRTRARAKLLTRREDAPGSHQTPD